jgi:hypothetical protein
MIGASPTFVEQCRRKGAHKAGGGGAMTDPVDTTYSTAHQSADATPTARLKRHPRRPGKPFARRDGDLRYEKVHSVTVQGMRVSLPWLDFMAKRPR